MRRSTAVVAAFVTACVVAVGAVVVLVITSHERAAASIAPAPTATSTSANIPSQVVTVPTLSSDGPPATAVNVPGSTSSTTGSATGSTVPSTTGSSAPGTTPGTSTPPARSSTTPVPTTPTTASRLTTPRTTSTPATPPRTTPNRTTGSAAPPSTVSVPADYQHVMGWVSNQRVVSLTFDDGPGPQTGAVLDVLDRYGIKATFCQIGEQVADYPAIERRITADGHTICNHSWDHDEHLASKPAATIDSEISRTQTAITEYSGQTPVWYRAPGGDFAGTVLQQQEVKYRTRPLGWGVDSEDWRKPGVSAIVNNVMSEVTPGAVILFHDAGGDRSQTLAALPKVIQALRAKGYGFVVLPRH